MMLRRSRYKMTQSRRHEGLNILETHTKNVLIGEKQSLETIIIVIDLLRDDIDSDSDSS